ncbi:uncharacterized protein si:ch73-347e22.8 [Xyrichtys novacula]|uniref:Uncharacterized protein si:ch73-347e22.8 n=1 Tax=Xyrichtys novacula TaxID=13765 RepID=A0AAV1HCJ6_XYRNO|nr:uncharacterized protein si:ch73-347e22.8 [Xyrichtys novacula]
MRIQWIVSIVSNLVSMGLLVIVMGQYQVLNIQKQREEKLKTEVQRLANEYANDDLSKVTMEKLLADGNKTMTELEAAMAKLSPELEKKRKDVDACQAEKVRSFFQFPKIITLTRQCLFSIFYPIHTNMND